jgi:hypothetical protein
VRNAILATLLLLTSAMAAVAQKSVQQQVLIAVTRPTIIAFFSPVDDSSTDADTNEAMADFQWYAMEARKKFRNTQIDFHEIYTHSFRVQVGNKVTMFRPGKVEIGYYFIRPGKTPRVQYGVMTDADLLQLAKEYFGIEVK